MSKKLLNKLLSAVLVLAICSATVFGCMLNVSALTYNGTYTVSVGDENNHVAYMSKYITAEVTFNLDAGFSWGEFSVAKSADNDVTYAGVTVEPVSATLTSGETLDASGLKELGFAANVLDPLDATTNLNDILFETGVADNYYTSLTLKLTLEVAESTSDTGYINRETEYSVTVSVADNAIGAKTENAETKMTDASNGSNSYHVNMTAWVTNSGTVTSTACAVCKSDLIQVYVNPYKEELTVANGPWGWLLASGVTVDYEDDGSISINVHGRFYYGSEHYVMVTDANGNIIDKYSGSVTLTDSHLAGTALTANNNSYIKSYTIGGLSANDIDSKLYITLAVKFDNNVQVSNTISFTLADYCTAVVEGDKVVYPEAATDEQKEADKDVAASLYYYGASVNDYLNNKDNVSSGGSDSDTSTEVETVEMTTDTWDGTLVEPTTPDKDGTTILITSAEELAWIALKGDSATAGKTYKVADGIDTFYLTPNGASDYDNTSLDKLKESLSTVATSDGSTTHSWISKAYISLVSGWASFQGTFDGNGVTICGMPAVETGGSAGLFPYVKGNVSIKNVKITDSYICGSRNAGAFVGAPFAHENNRLTSISFENCAVVGNYIEQTTANTDPGWSNVGGLAGAIRNTGSVNVDSCLIVDNEFGNASSATFKERAFFGDWVNYDTTTANVSIKDSVTDENPYANGWYPCNPSNYSNIYTTCTDAADNQADSFTDANVKVLTSAQMQGANAVSTMKLDETVWLATSGYPELRVFHEIKAVSNGESGHSEKCVEVAVMADGTEVPCTVCGVSETAHNTVTDSSTQTIICTECDYSYSYGEDALYGLPDSIRARLENNSLWNSSFATTDLFKTAYDADTNPTAAKGQPLAGYEDCYFYATSLNLKTSPYIGFTFAFLNNYKTDRAGITVKFTVNGTTYTSAAVETDGVLGENWVNNDGAGRYHLYGLVQIPAIDMCKPVKVTLNYSGTAIEMGTYSAAGFAINAINAGDAYKSHAKASMALVFYSEMLAARYAQ